MIDLSNFAKTLDNKSIAIFGLGVSGMASLEACINARIKVIAWDDNEMSRKTAEEKGAICKPLDTETLSVCACLILAPGVPLTHPTPHAVVIAAQTAGIEILSDIEILHRCNHGRQTIGITGTNGKSTTTALLNHTLNACGVDACMGGNIGVAALAMDLPPEGGVVVFEMSSYQIDLCPTFRPDIGVLLNITPDHLDRHGTMENYTAVKMRMLDGARNIIMGKDLDLHDARIAEHDFPALQGDHNKQNILAVLEVCKTLGVDEARALSAIKTFPGLAHRQYLARKIGSVKYINDSKATNAQACAKALAAYDDIYWIAGGQAKSGGLSGLEDFMPRVKHAFLIGEAADEFKIWLEAQGICATISKTLDAATRAAHDMAQKNDQGTVLLSPACASWDQFTSFEARGDDFVKIVEGFK